MFSAFLLISSALFALGAAVGSFLNVLIYRSIREESWVTGRSKCDHCGRKIAWYDNIPVLSYLVLRGQSRCCSKPIPLSYPVVEFITGILFVWWYWGGSLFFHLTTEPLQILQPLFWLLVGILLLLIFFADLLYMIIPDLAVGVLLVITVLYRVYLATSGVMQLNDLLLAMMGVVIAVSLLGGLWLVTKGKGMGLGDIKYAVPMALLLGWPRILVGLFLAFILGGIVAMGLIIAGRKKFGQIVPFGPFLVVATAIALIWGEFLYTWYIGLLMG